MGKSRDRRNRRNRSVKRRKIGGNGDITYYHILNGQYRYRTNKTGWTELQNGNPIDRDNGYYVQSGKVIYKHNGEGL